MLEGFLTAYPDDPAADQAAFAAANALLDLKALRRGGRGLRPLRRPLSEERLAGQLLVPDRLLPISPPASTEAALEMCRKVAEAKRLDKRHRPRGESPNKWQAIYILGQIYHSLGQAADADPRVSPRGGPLQPTPGRRSTTSSARRSSCPRSPRSSRASRSRWS